jgi:Malonyl-CoA decarboxylase C-terminal domain
MTLESSRLLVDSLSRSICRGPAWRPRSSLVLPLGSTLAHPDVLAKPLERLALAYLAQARQNGKLYHPVVTFHLSNGERLERINTFGYLRPYGLRDSFGVTANYRYLPDELEENHERFVRGEIQVASDLLSEYKLVTKGWQRSAPETRMSFATRSKKVSPPGHRAHSDFL